MSKNFFYRINPSEVLAELISVDNRESWLIQFFNDLRNDDQITATSKLAQTIIAEAHSFREKRSKAGKASAEKKSTNAQHTATYVEHMPTDVQQCPTSSSSNTKPIKEAKTKFVIPTIAEIKTYCQTVNIKIDAACFHDYYTSNGWTVSGKKMVDWQATCRNWGRRDFNKPKPTPENNPACVTPPWH